MVPWQTRVDQHMGSRWGGALRSWRIYDGLHQATEFMCEVGETINTGLNSQSIARLLQLRCASPLQVLKAFYVSGMAVFYFATKVMAAGFWTDTAWKRHRDCLESRRLVTATDFGDGRAMTRPRSQSGAKPAEMCFNSIQIQRIPALHRKWIQTWGL